MSTEKGLQIFDSEEFGKVRVVQENGELWFVGRDVLKALDYAASSDVNKIFSDIPAEWKGRKIFPTLGGEQQVTVISEQGLYFFLGGSNKPKALPFRKHVAGTIMPSIRKHGAYMTPDVLAKTIADPAYIIGVVTALQQEQEARKLAEQKVLEYTPAHKFVEDLKATGDLFYGDEVAKQISTATKLDIGREKFYNWLRQNEFLFKQDRHYPNVVTQKAISMKLIDPKPETVNGRTYIVPKFTVKGLMFFVEAFMEMVRNGFAGFDKQGHALYKGEGRAQLSLFSINGG